MEPHTSRITPHRITDLVRLKTEGAEVVCNPSFEILPVDFAHRRYQFRAHVFLCRFNDEVDHISYSFRKCYARGCPHNLCPQVAQAVMIANRHLQRDLRILHRCGIAVEQRLFSLDDMVVKFEKLHKDRQPFLEIYDYIEMAAKGTAVSVAGELEYVPAVEHFVGHKNARTFLMGSFAVTTLGQPHLCQHCFACYATENTAEEQPIAVEVANARLRDLYQQFEQAGIQYQKRFFELNVS